MREEDLFTAVDACRICGSGDLFPVLDLGRQPLANCLLPPASSTPPSYPLATVGCPRCGVMQLSGTVDPRALFDEYLYFSSYSSSMVSAMRRLAGETVSRYGLGAQDLVVEIASNDGYLLRHYRDLGVGVLGIEPAANVARLAQDAGVDTRVDYFTPEVASELVARRPRPRVIHANNVLAHVPDIHRFVEAIHILLAEDGVAIVETPYLLDLIDHELFETIYHEHVFYYSLGAVAELFGQHGMQVHDCEHLAVHGGSLRITLCKRGVLPATARVAETRDLEGRRELTSALAYGDFARGVSQSRAEIVQEFGDVRARGQSLAGYGAAAKATVLLNFAGIDSRTLAYVVDKNPAKQGRIIPGTGIEVLPVERLHEDPPDVLAILIWNLAAEVSAELDWFTAAGGKLIVPLENRRHLDRGIADSSAPSHTR
jgi:SAM-dependent methyltransferase